MSGVRTCVTRLVIGAVHAKRSFNFFSSNYHNLEKYCIMPDEKTEYAPPRQPPPGDDETRSLPEGAYLMLIGAYVSHLHISRSLQDGLGSSIPSTPLFSMLIVIC